MRSRLDGGIDNNNAFAPAYFYCKNCCVMLYAYMPFLINLYFFCLLNESNEIRGITIPDPMGFGIPGIPDPTCGVSLGPGG